MTLKQQYAKERARLNRNVKSLEKRGYIVPENYIPKKPKKITKASINRLEKLNAQRYQKSAKIISSRATGELIKVKGTAPGKAINPKVIPEKDFVSVAFADTILSNFRRSIASFGNAQREMVKEWYSELLATKGKEGTAKIIEEVANSGIWQQDFMYGSDQNQIETASAAIENLNNYLTERALPQIGEGFDWGTYFDELETV